MSTRIHRGFQPEVSHRRMRLIVLSLLTLGVSMINSWDFVQADVMIFKDGFTVEGKVKRESTVLVEGSVIMSVPKQNSFFLVDDGARRIFFPYRQVQNVEAKDVNRGQPDLRFDRPLVRVDARRLPAGQYLDFGPWNATWDRKIHIQTQRQRKPEVIDQHLSTLTPHYALIAARWYNWDSYYLLKELDPASIRALLPSHPSMKKDGGKGDLEKRFTVFRFLIEAGFFDQAAAELDSIQKDFPEDKERVDAKREALRKLLLAQLVDLIEEAQKAGRHGWAQARLANFPVQGLDESLLARLRTLQSAYEAIEKNLSLARRF
ncbi:MAG TPA: hypothetical protein VKI17_05990, partial [Gemmataceae bacterium]|nr:hypothetical protein [Gemmataceae bacterium]